MKLTLYLLLLYSLFVQPAFAQFGMGGPPHPSAVLDLKSPTNDKGFYPPRLTTVQRKAITNAQPGMFVYDLDQNTFYLFDGANWLPLAFQHPASIMPTTRLASDGVAGDNFGFRVAISGDYALVGASGKTIGSNTNQGAAYVFVRSGSSWTQQERLTASDGALDDAFGSVAISGDYALVGASNKTIGSNDNQGAAYVFVWSGSSWTQQARLTASDGAASDRFGYSVAISRNYALVGAYDKTIFSTPYQGAAYIFQESSFVFPRTWPQRAKLTASDGASGDLFGFSVAILGDYALVGAAGKNIDSNGTQGAAYVFVRSGSSWTQQARLTASDGAARDRFGISVAISGNYALVGAYDKTIGSNNKQGAAYVFVRNGTTWPQLRAITDNSPADTYNGSVGLSNGAFIIGGRGFQNDQGKVSFGVVDN